LRRDTVSSPVAGIHPWMMAQCLLLIVIPVFPASLEDPLFKVRKDP
jgi:hypothetical protein